MSEIVKFPFSRDKFDQIRAYKFGHNWPVVYLIKDEKEIYIGQTTNVFYRSKSHWENPARQKLKDIHVISDEEYNISAALDIESSLIEYMSADGSFILQNGNDGLRNHNYFDREKYRAKFEVIWEKLRQMSLVKKDLVQIRNSDVFKYSPYKSLTEDQISVVADLFENLKSEDSKTYIINGKPGTGKTILAIYLIKYLREKEETKHLKVGLVIPMTSLRRTIKNVFSSISGLRSSLVIGPGDVTGEDYDILIVDEAHRLKRRVNLANYSSFDNTNKKLDLDNSGTELDWILRSSKHQIFFYDKNQTIKPTDIRPESFSKLNAIPYELTSQMRISAGVEYTNFIDDLFDDKEIHKYKFENYDFKIYDSIHDMIKHIKEKDKELKLCRVVAGYAWNWSTRDGLADFDIEIDGLKLIWNSTAQDWVNSPNAINEVGCIHTVQGYDLNYTGVIIGPELSYDEINKRLVVDPDKYRDINGRRSISDPKELERYIINIYKTLLTRGIKGAYVYIADEKLAKYFKDRLKGKSKAVESKIYTKTKSPYIGSFIGVPLFDSVGCGDLMFADSTVQEMIPVKEQLMSKGSKYFVLRTSGDSMNRVGINDGDLVLCRKDYHPEEGNNVVALIGNDATIKEYRRENGSVVLKPHSTNSKHQSLIFTSNDEMRVQGVVVCVLRDDYENK